MDIIIGAWPTQQGTAKAKLLALEIQTTKDSWRLRKNSRTWSKRNYSHDQRMESLDGYTVCKEYSLTRTSVGALKWLRNKWEGEEKGRKIDK